MSKAFLPEDGAGPDEDEGLEDESASKLPAGTKNYITRTGFEKLKSELKNLLNVERPSLVQTVAWAASNGDRSENGDYIYGKRRLREIDRRIRFLTKRLDAAEVIDPEKQVGDRVLFGATVEIENENGERKTYQIVGIDETDVRNGKISWISPLGKALLQAKVGDSILLQTPKGEEELSVIRFEFK